MSATISQERMYICETCGKTLFREEVIAMFDEDNNHYLFCSVLHGEHFLIKNKISPHFSTLSLIRIYKNKPLELVEGK